MIIASVATISVAIWHLCTGQSLQGPSYSGQYRIRTAQNQGACGTYTLHLIKSNFPHLFRQPVKGLFQTQRLIRGAYELNLATNRTSMFDAYNFITINGIRHSASLQVEVDSLPFDSFLPMGHFTGAFNGRDGGGSLFSGSYSIHIKHGCCDMEDAHRYRVGDRPIPCTSSDICRLTREPGSSIDSRWVGHGCSCQHNQCRIQRRSPHDGESIEFLDCVWCTNSDICFDPQFHQVNYPDTQ